MFYHRITIGGGGEYQKFWRQCFYRVYIGNNSKLGTGFIITVDVANYVIMVMDKPRIIIIEVEN